ATCSSASAQGYGRVWARGIHSLYTLNVRPRLHHAAHASAPAAPDLGAPPPEEEPLGREDATADAGLACCRPRRVGSAARPAAGASIKARNCTSNGTPDWATLQLTLCS